MCGRRRWVSGFIGLLGVLLLGLGARAPSGPYIQGVSQQHGWELALQGPVGTFRVEEETWPIELIFKGLGQAGFANTLWLLGRKADNYVLVFAFVNTAGESFRVWYFDYKRAREASEAFVGEYTISGLLPRPSLWPEGSYVPAGPVPDYVGEDFRVASPYAQVAPAGGTVTYKGLHLEVYPVLQVTVPGAWSEFWAVGWDPVARNAYHLIFYSHRVQAWIIDLRDGGVSLFPLGQAVITGGQVQVPHPVELGGR